ncbi:hypothetical protein BVC80_9099g82 [Macleaya cordata]|uniref:Uncharacterized protein n=1 Tax=Macleaya cordata TaxID=56857 RepID=A0A200PVS8_MACCD|nr:hypothetical protein BVC80_9099g82 [Macleaya cordata]
MRRDERLVNELSGVLENSQFVFIYDTEDFFSRSDELMEETPARKPNIIRIRVSKSSAHIGATSAQIGTPAPPEATVNIKGKGIVKEITYGGSSLKRETGKRSVNFVTDFYNILEKGGDPNLQWGPRREDFNSERSSDGNGLVIYNKKFADGKLDAVVNNSYRKYSEEEEEEEGTEAVQEDEDDEEDKKSDFTVLKFLKERCENVSLNLQLGLGYLNTAVEGNNLVKQDVESMMKRMGFMVFDGCSARCFVGFV